MSLSAFPDPSIVTSDELAAPVVTPARYDSLPLLRVSDALVKPAVSSLEVNSGIILRYIAVAWKKTNKKRIERYKFFFIILLNIEV